MSQSITPVAATRAVKRERQDVVKRDSVTGIHQDWSAGTFLKLEDFDSKSLAKLSVVDGMMSEQSEQEQEKEGQGKGGGSSSSNSSSSSSSRGGGFQGPHLYWTVGSGENETNPS